MRRTYTVTDRLSITHLVPTMGWGGAERLACTIHRMCVQSGFVSRLEIPSFAKTSSGMARDLNIPVTEFRGEATLGEWFTNALSRIRLQKPDIIHAHLPYPDRLGITLALASTRPLVVTFQLLPGVSRSWSVDEWLGIRSDKVLRVGNFRPWRTCYVAVSRDDRERLSRYFGGRLTMIANAPPLAPLGGTSRSRYVWPEGVTRLLAVGRLHEQKGLDLLIRALSDGEVRDLPWHFLIAGDGDSYLELAEQIRSVGLGHKIEIDRDRMAYQLYPDADLVLCASRWEGMPLVPMEAVEAGVSVLASRIAPHEEYFSGVEGSLLPEEVGSWSSYIRRYILDKGVRMDLANEQREKTVKSPRDEMFRMYSSLYQSLAAR